MNEEIYISPSGCLRGAGSLFCDGVGAGLLTLLETSAGGESSPVAVYFRALARACIHKLVQLDPEVVDADNLSAQLCFSESEISTLLLSAPPMTGGEYLTNEALDAMTVDVYRAVSVRAQREGKSPIEIVRLLVPGGRNLGKVSFHLAENKGQQSEKYPFAFLSSFIYAVSESDKAKHVPLKKALQLYANNPAKLKATLGPIEEAARESAFLRDLLTSRRIFMPALWSSRDAFQFLRDIPVFEKAGIVVRVVNLWKGMPAKAKVSVSVGKGKGTLTAESLLNFDVSLTVNGNKLTPEEIREIFASPGGLVRVRGEWVEADGEKLGDLMKRWEAAQKLARSEGVSMIKALRLLAGTGDGALPADDENVAVEAGAGLKEMLRDLQNPSGIKVPPLADELEGVLRPYQKDGVKFLWRASEIGIGVCLADDMGLGKTLQLLSLASLWKESGALEKCPALFILPATLLANWRDECAKWTPWMKPGILHPSSFDQKGFRAFKADPLKVLSKYDLVFTTYGMVTRLDELKDIEFPAVVADEAQAIKNAGTKQSISVRSVKALRRIALTGTPVENRLTDLWSLFDFINPGLLGSLSAFQKDYGKPSENAQENMRLYGRLRKLTRPFILRRCKTDKSVIPDLPDKTEVKVHCALSSRQMALYRDIVENLRKALEDDSLKEDGNGIKRRGLVLASLMQFKQVCNHPSQYVGEGEWAEGESGKFERLREIAEQVKSRQEKMLVFTQFREMTNPIHDFLAECFGRPGLILHGGTSVKDRAARVKAFQSEEGAPFFVLSLKAAGVGLNLTRANHVVHFDRWWNPAVENQASDRAYRIGQKRNVLVHKFLCDGTIEEKIDSLIDEKKELADSIFSAGTEKLLTDMSDKELLDFVKLDADN